MQKNVIIIPTYNNPKTIKAVAFDVVEHGYEAIVVDDGSDVEVNPLFFILFKKRLHFHI